MSRRKPLAPRKPSGRVYSYATTRDTALLSPTQVRRMVDAAGAEARDPLWATMIGRIYLAGKLSATEFAAGKRWSELVASYSIACRSPRPPTTISFDEPGGSGLDVDSPRGECEVIAHERINAAWLAGRNALRLAGRDAERVVDHVCARDCALAGFGELNALRAGLQALAALWAAKRKASAR
jgi:hypothetical protein